MGRWLSVVGVVLALGSRVIADRGESVVGAQA